jgi:hypothetical protein
MEASMDMNMYALERYVEMMLREARETSARAALASGLPENRRPFSVFAALAGAGRWLFRRAARGGASLPSPTAP